MHATVTFNDSQNRYDMTEAGHVVYADVRRARDVLYIDYVYAPPELRGTGAAGRFMAGLMDIVRGEGRKVTPICGYAAGWLQRHSEYSDLLAKR